MNTFTRLNSINVNEKTEDKNNLTYLSWVYAWSTFKKECPEATYKIKMFDGKPYIFDEETGYMVFTEVTVDGLTHEMWLPVMDGANKSMMHKIYSYIVGKGKNWESQKEVDKASMFDINKTLMRCLTKNLAMFGLGLYIYAGEDLPDPAPKQEMTDDQIVGWIEKTFKSIDDLEEFEDRCQELDVKLQDKSEKVLTKYGQLYTDKRNELTGSN